MCVSWVVIENEMVQLGHAAKCIVGYVRQAVAVQMKGAEVLQIVESVRHHQSYRVPRKRQVHQFGHVGEILPLDARDEIVPQTELDGASVDVWRDEQQPLFITQGCQIGRQNLANTALGTYLDLLGL